LLGNLNLQIRAMSEHGISRRSARRLLAQCLTGDFARIQAHDGDEVNNHAPVVRFRVDGTELDDKAASEFVEEVVLSKVDSVRACTVFSYRSGERPVLMEAEPGKDIVVVKIGSGPALLLHPETARDLLTSGEAVRRTTLSEYVPVTATLPWTEESPAQRRGGESYLRPVIQWFGVVRLNLVDVDAQATALAIAENFDGRVRERLYQLQRDSLPENLAHARQSTEHLEDNYRGEPLLVLIHGTFVNTAGTFGRLWQEHPETVKELFDRYDGRVFAFDHATTTRSPIANAVALAGELPSEAVVHFLTHSRGGLIAEILVRASANGLRDGDFADFIDPDVREGDVELLRELRDTLHNKHIKIERVVRIGCPARGTLLASLRLDAYLSVIRWLMDLARLPIAPHLLLFLREVARQGVKPDMLPGIAAMVPDSPLIRWLNSPMEQVASSLYVIAGESVGDSVKSWVKTLVAEAYYWTDNDLVVQTRSMYGGAPRGAEDIARFVLLQGGQVSHFSYFSLNESVETIVDALLSPPDRQRKDWRSIGPLSWRGWNSSGVRAAAVGRVTQSSVFVVPDFFGSHLAVDGKRIWLSTRSVTEFARLKVNEDAGSDRVTATELVFEIYGNLCNRLSETYKVVPFPYDWRLSIEVEAKRLAERLSVELSERSDPSLPIRIIAHGMGGLLLRALHMNHRRVWEAMMAIEGVRIIMLGTPNSGSWTPIQALSGEETFGNVFSSTGPLFGDATIRETLSGMPGFVQLQGGLLDPASNLGSAEGWAALEKIQKDALERATRWHRPRKMWSIPSQPLLTNAKVFWRELNQQLPELSRDMANTATVVGAARNTPCGIVNEGGQLFLTSTEHGDGRVTLESAQLPGSAIWCMNAEHGLLPAEPTGFAGLVDLLEEGKTSHLKKHEPPNKSTRQPKPHEHIAVKALGIRQPDPPCCTTPPGGMVDLFNVIQDDELEQASFDRLRVKVYHGDLRFVREALLVGHYQSLSLTGSEAVVDTLVGGRMNKAVRAGIYPERVGSYQIFENGRNTNLGRQRQRYIPRPKAAIIVGLGEEGKLNAQHLSFTIRNGILAFAERLAEDPDCAATFEIAATLVGSGGTGVTVGNAALALVQAITDGNARLKEVSWPQVSALKIVELFLDRAADALRVLKMHAQANPDRIDVEPILAEGNGSLRRSLDSSYRGATYDFISARKAVGSQDGHPAIAYSLDTKRARTEVRAQSAQGSLLRDLVAEASNSAHSDPLIGRTLFNLLVPVEIEPYLAGSTDIVMELDRLTSALPWELLDTEPDANTESTSAPWAIRSKVIRKLQVEQYRAQIVDASLEDNVLIIGEPLVDSSYGSLQGAQREAKAIYTVARAALGPGTERVTLLADHDDAHRIINQLFARNYRMVHIAGHGAVGQDGGVVLSGSHTFLGPNEILAMRVTPELVFVNCCYSAKRADKPTYDRVSFAASVADALINIGVRCVVAAGWAVEDTPAEKFATTFYKALFNGARYIDAVGQARRAAWEANPEGNTWAAYQCYGDPDWSWRDAGTATPPSPDEEFAGVSSPAILILVLQSIATEAVYATAGNVERHRARLKYLEKKFPDWTKRGEVAQAFGKAYADLSDRKVAIEWFGKARDASDGGATLFALELYAEQKSLPEATVDELHDAIRILKALIAEIKPTLRRHSLLGNALKRLSVVTEDLYVLKYAIENFTEAARFRDEKYNFYPARNVLECELRRHLLTSTDLLPANWSDAQIAEVGRLIDKAAHDEPDFWSIVAQSQLDILKAIVHCRLQRVLPEIEASLNDLRNRIVTQRYWIYIRDEVQFLLVPYSQFVKDRDQAEADAADFLMQLLQGYR
jgi:tetratricopeptide (TPR) repeat protein